MKSKNVKEEIHGTKLAVSLDSRRQRRAPSCIPYLNMTSSRIVENMDNMELWKLF